MARGRKCEDLGRRVGGLVRMAEVDRGDFAPGGALSFLEHAQRRNALRGWLFGRPRITETIWSGPDHDFCVVVLASVERPGLLRIIKFNMDGPFEERSELDREQVADMLMEIFGVGLKMWPRDDTRALIGWPHNQRSIFDSLDDIP